MAEQKLVAGIDAGGTSFKCILATGPDDIKARFNVPTAEDPSETWDGVITGLKALQAEGHDFAVIGLASFGPLIRDRTATDYGHIGDCAKPGWSGADLTTPLKDALGLSVALETDVNGALLGEVKWGAGQGFGDVAYVTVGTGVGVGILTSGILAGGRGHPEAGHIRLARTIDDQQAFAGICPFHGDCLEGLASGPAIAARWGVPAESLGPDHPAWALAGQTLAQLAGMLAYTTKPSRIIFGGGVMQEHGLIGHIRSAFPEVVAGFALPLEAGDISQYIVPAGLGNDAGALGAVHLAQAQLDHKA